MNFRKTVPLALCLVTVGILSVAAAMAPEDQPTWKSVIENPEIRIEVNLDSLAAELQPEGVAIRSQFRINLFHEIDVDGKTKKGWYYVNDMTTLCRSGEMYIDKSTVYAKDGEALVTGASLGKVPSSKNPKSFVNLWAKEMCSDFVGKRPTKIM
jgi:hypothetical protein